MSTFDFNLVRYTAAGLVWAVAPRRGVSTEFVGRITVNGKIHMKSSTCLSTVTDWLARMRPELHGQFANGGCH